MKIVVKNLKNRKVKEIDLPDAIFRYPFKEHLVHTAVQAYLAAQRSGSHKTKTRAEVSGSGRKPWRQKGTGRARIGSRRSPLWRKGGVAHGPVPRSYTNKLSAREKRNALKCVLSHKLHDDGLVVVDSLEIQTHKAAELRKQLARIGVEGKALLVDRSDNDNLRLAARNNRELKTVDALSVNVYDVVDRETVVLSERGLIRLVEVLGK